MRPISWRHFSLIVITGFFAVIATLALFVFLMNPYGNLYSPLFREHVSLDLNQRYQYPALIRSGRFDSIVVGTSNARLLSPARLEAVFGGSFANLAMNDARAWEQYQLVELFMRTIERPRLLIVALDSVWCSESAAKERITSRGFPEWMYDDNPWNDWLYMLNGKTVEIGFRRIGYMLGLRKDRYPAGYEVFTPPENTYDAEKASKNIWGANGLRQIRPVDPPYVPTSEERSGWNYPALDWLDDVLGRFPGEVVLAFMPVHVAAQPIPGSPSAARESECKERIVRIAQRYRVPLIDFRIPSEITSTDTNYWDALHYRLPIAERIVDGIKRALVTREDDPLGDWRFFGDAQQARASQ